MPVTRRAFLAASTLSAASLATAAATGRALAWQPETDSDPTIPPLRPTYFDWRELAPGVWATTGFTSGGNSLAVVGTDSALLVDTKFPYCAKPLRREVERHGSPLEFVVNTHHHGDHTAGNFEFSGNTQLIAHENAEPRIIDEGQTANYLRGIANGPNRAAGVESAETERVVAEAEAIEKRINSLNADDWAPNRIFKENGEMESLGGVSFELHHSGHAGHTDNDLAVRIPERNVLHAGDLVFSGLHPYCDPNGGLSVTGWVESLRVIRELCDDGTVVVPGHGAIGGPEIIDNQRAYLEQLIEAVQKDIDAGASEDEVARKSWDFMDGLGFERVRERAIRNTYIQLSE